MYNTTDYLWLELNIKEVCKNRNISQVQVEKIQGLGWAEQYNIDDDFSKHIAASAHKLAVSSVRQIASSVK